MKKLSANYSYSNHNFVIQNLRDERISNKYLPAIYILKNILQRGKPTLLSSFLQEKLGHLHKNKDFEKAYPLIDKELPNWERLIKGDVKGNYYPAKKFFEELIPKYLADYRFIQQLIIPEIEINEITNVEVDDFVNQQVDFYLPQAYLVIEIDGLQHEKDKDKDLYRDSYLKNYGIKTVRINTRDLEAENTLFFEKMKEIEYRIDKVINAQVHHKKEKNTFISLFDYKLAFQNEIDLENTNYKATAIIRFQLLILELLESGQLDLTKQWNFEIVEQDVTNFEVLAIDDLIIWFEHLLKLQKIVFKVPKISIKICNSTNDFSYSDETIKIDFSIQKRYTDEFQILKDIVFVRTDYLDEYRHFNSQHKFASFEQYDYFKISTTKPIKYKFKFGGKKSDENSLLFLLWNIFLQNNDNLKFETLKFIEGQLPIIANALSGNDTIGLLPTGSGKSVCYQLSAVLQPSISFVVCPIKSLMYDQKADLDSAFFSRINHITSDDSAEEKERTQDNFAQGKYFFIFISPERFQLKTFRQYFSSVNQKFSFAYAIIDEVHCLSEWGHDFRTSYLNLSNTINKHCSNFNFLGLTATASINVLKDIQIEFGIKQENIKTPVDYTRKELEFIVIDDENHKNEVIKEQLENLKNTNDALEIKGNNTKCGIIFTPTVNGSNGCYSLSQNLSNHFQRDIKYYSGSVPKVNKQPIMSNFEFDVYKKEVQKDFKQNKFSLLTATKAFGMGVNKGNIHYTFHYGIPASMESLYQEAGRAGREKAKFVSQKAQCFVLLSKSSNDIILSQIWDRKTILSKVNKLQKQVNGDVKTNLFLFTLGLDVIKEEFEIIKKLHLKYSSSNKKNILIKGKEIRSNKARTEKAIYRLSQLGIIEDWTISNFFGGGIFEVDYKQFSINSIRISLLNTIRKYDREFSFEKIQSSNHEHNQVYKKILESQKYSELDKYILILLQWSYDNFAYNRRKSLKDIYELCCNYESSIAGKAKFKRSLEAYFKFTQKSYIFDHIAENPNDYKKWFEVFYQIDNNLITDKFITNREQNNLKDNLNRFLQSYMYNTGLDLISGLLRLFLDDYNNSDGRNRFESSLEQIKNYQPYEKEFIITQLLKLGKKLNRKNKNFLAESLYKFFNDNGFLLRISKSLEDTYSINILVQKSIKRLKIINEKLHGRFREIR